MRDIVNQLKINFSNADGIADLKQTVPLKTLAPKKATIPTIQIAVNPARLSLKNFSMAAATAFVFDDDSIGWGPTDSYRLAGDESINIGSLIAFSGNEICHGVNEH